MFLISMPYRKENGKDLSLFLACFHKFCLFLLVKLWPGFSKALNAAPHDCLSGLAQNRWEIQTASDCM